MNSTLILLIAVGAGLLLFWALYKLVKAVLFAMMAAVIVAAALFYYLPRMEPTSGQLEELRQHATEINSGIHEKQKAISEKVDLVSGSLQDIASLAENIGGIVNENASDVSPSSNGQGEAASSKKNQLIMEVIQNEGGQKNQPMGQPKAVQNLNVTSTELMETLTNELRRAKERSPSQ